MLNWLIRKIRDSKLLKKYLNVVNSIGIHKRLIPAKKFRELISKAQPGDIVLIRKALEATNQFFGLYDYSHAVMIGYGYDIVDATGDAGVSVRDQLELLQGTAKISLRRPKLTKEQITSAIDQAYIFSNMGISYDYKFSSTLKDMYCSELIYHSFNKVVPNFIELRERFGEMTVTPQDLALMADQFETIMEFEA